MSEEPNDIEARKNELFATITLLAGAKRDLVGARGARRLALIDRQAQLEGDKERLSHEVNSQYMYRNLQAFMNRVDAYDAARKEEARETHSGLAALGGQFREMADDVSQLKSDVGQLKSDMADGQQDRQAIKEDVAAVKADVAAIDMKFAAFQDQLDTYIAGSKRGDVAELQAQMSELMSERTQYTPAQRAQLFESLLQLLAWWDAGRPDKAGG